MATATYRVDKAQEAIAESAELIANCYCGEDDVFEDEKLYLIAAITEVVANTRIAPAAQGDLISREEVEEVLTELKNIASKACLELSTHSRDDVLRALLLRDMAAADVILKRIRSLPAAPKVDALQVDDGELKEIQRRLSEEYEKCIAPHYRVVMLADIRHLLSILAALPDDSARIERLQAQLNGVLNCLAQSQKDVEHWRSMSATTVDARAAAEATQEIVALLDCTTPLSVGGQLVTDIKQIILKHYGVAAPAGDGWQPIETAPKDGRALAETYAAKEVAEAMKRKCIETMRERGIIIADMLSEESEGRTVALSITQYFITALESVELDGEKQ